MELWESEIDRARGLIAASGRDSGDFEFKIVHLPPDEDDMVMWTARYRVEITHKPSGKTLETIGGIGMEWVGLFEEELREGEFG